MFKFAKAVVAGIIVGLAGTGLAGCAPTAPMDIGTTAGATPTTIVVANYPLEYLAAKLDPSARIVALTPPGTEPHDLELTPTQLTAIAGADLVVYEPGFQPAVDAAIAATTPKRVVDVTVGVTMREADDAHVESDHADHADHDHEGGLDPHIWLDPTNMVIMAKTIADAIGPDADVPLAALTAELTALDVQFKTGLTNCQHREFITTHAAFGYLAARYQLTQIPIDGLDPSAEPSAARIAQVQALAQEHQLTTIFTEPLASGEVATSMAADLGLATDVLDPVEGITATSRGSDYPAIMAANLEALRKANMCS